MNSEPLGKYILILYHAIAYSSILLRRARHHQIVLNNFMSIKIAFQLRGDKYRKRNF
jgi:hypothetical protein